MEQKDRNLSAIIYLLIFALMFYAFSISNSTVSLDGKTLKDIILFLFDNYLDFILIGYVFICFQIAGYVELRYKQDFITVSLLSIKTKIKINNKDSIILKISNLDNERKCGVILN